MSLKVGNSTSMRLLEIFDQTGMHLTSRITRRSCMGWDSRKILDNFYASCGEIQNLVRNLSHDQLSDLCKNALGYGVRYLEARKEVYEKNGPPFDEVLNKVEQYKKSQACGC
jgi:hypothetical protein